MMEKYHIGQIDASTIPAKRAHVHPQQAPSHADKDNDLPIKILQFLVPIMILGLALSFGGPLESIQLLEKFVEWHALVTEP